MSVSPTTDDHHRTQAQLNGVGSKAVDDAHGIEGDEDEDEG